MKSSKRHKRPVPGNPKQKDRFGFDSNDGSGAWALNFSSEPEETKICGRNACLARAEQHASSIVRAYLSSARQIEFSKLMKELAATKRAYHIVDESVLEKVTGTVHHEGVCLIVNSQAALNCRAFFQYVRKQREAPLVILDGVANPHNLGAITRVAAHFGVVGIFVIQAEVPHSQFMSASFFRIAQGGAEHVVLGCGAAADSEQLFSELREMGYEVIGTTCAQAGKQIFSQKLVEKSAYVFGSESQGISLPVSKQISRWVTLPGTGNVESLNVACAAAATLAEHWRQNLRH